MLVPEKEEVVQEPIKLSRRDALYSPIQKEYLEEKAGLPVLSLETDNCDSRTYSAASMRTKVETFAEMLKAKKGRSDSMKSLYKEQEHADCWWDSISMTAAVITQQI